MTVRGIRWFGGGRCLAVDEETGETYTVARLMPGERATVVRYERGGRRFPVADRILKPSPHRIAPSCRHYAACAGCDLLHVTEAEEAAYKRLTVTEVLARHADVSVEFVDAVGGAARGAHRARARFTVTRNHGRVSLGLRGLSGAVLDIADCPASVPVVRVTMAELRDLIERMPMLPLTGVEVAAGVEGVAVTFETLAWDDERGAALVADVQALPVVVATAVREKGGDVRLLSGAWPRQLSVCDVQLEPAPDAWTQPTPTRATALYSWVLGLGLHHGRRVLDATCGTGGLALALASTAREVVGVDANWDAVKSAMASAQALGLTNTRFRGGKIETVAPRLGADGERFETLVINPMRRSLGDQCMADLSALGAGSIVYLAPAPRAGASDVRALASQGFTVERVASVNLHPGTSKGLMAVVMSRPSPARG